MPGCWLFRLTCLPEVIGYSLTISVVLSTDLIHGTDYLVSIRSGVARVGMLCAGKENDAEIVS